MAILVCCIFDDACEFGQLSQCKWLFWAIFGGKVSEPDFFMTFQCLNGASEFGHFLFVPSGLTIVKMAVFGIFGDIDPDFFNDFKA